MHPFKLLFVSYFTIFSHVWALEPGPSKLEERQSTGTSVPAPPVDIGYGIYQGYYNETSQLNIYKGYGDVILLLIKLTCYPIYILTLNRVVLTRCRIRYAAPPTGTLRWQKPQPPTANRSQTIAATAYPPRCPQGNDSPL